jgi:micrococcal nuclease
LLEISMSAHSLRPPGALTGALLLLCASAACAQPSRNQPETPLPDDLEARVRRVYDGDTIRVRTLGRDETVRLLGVDCPEVSHPPRPAEHFGPEAAAFARRLAGGKKVSLGADALANRRDKYGRLLRYVILPDGRLLNALLIEEGYCRVLAWFPFERREEFTRLEAAARARAFGLWQTYPERDAAGQAGEVAAPLISWREAHRYYGERVTVTGRVIDTKNTGKACFLNFHPDWRQTFTAVIFARDFGLFPSPPEKLFLEKEVRVTGRVQEYRGKPEIVITAPSQIRIVNGP